MVKSFFFLYESKSFLFLGRSLIYGTTIHNGFSYNCHTVFGGHGRAHGEMMDPSGLFLDSTGNIISADSKNDRIQVYQKKNIYFSYKNDQVYFRYLDPMVNLKQH